MARFGIDIDGTVTCPTSLLPHINEAFNTQLVLDDIREYDLTAAFPVDRIQFYKWFKEQEPVIYASSPIQEHAKRILDEWKQHYELYFISARGDNVLDVTYDWFKQQELHYDHIELIGSHNKVATAKIHQVDAFFEDKHDNAVEIGEELDIPVLLFDTPYNRLPVPKQVVRVYNWQEADDWIRHHFPIQK